MRIKLPKRPINGILLLDKPIGASSNHALKKLQRLFQAEKAGHTGSLDPLATGMLPICLGEATKLSQYLLDADKTYEVVAKLGSRTTTADAEGEIIEERAVPELTLAGLEKQFTVFQGEISQMPPMYSALKFQGQPLYKLARQGIEIERKPRNVMIYELKLLRLEENSLAFEVRCSKGTYVRSLVDEMGELLGCGAHVAALRRTSVAGFSQDQMLNFEELEKLQDLATLDQHLLPMGLALRDWPEVVLDANTAFYFKQGQAVMVPKLTASGSLKVFDKLGNLIGLGALTEDGRLGPSRVFKI